MAETQLEKIGTLREAILRFVAWLDRYGETSYDHQSYFASDLGRRAKALYYRKPLLGTLAVSPMIFSEAFISLGATPFLEAAALSHSGRPLCDGLCVSISDSRFRALP